jgi:hypothetical protein
MMNVATLTASLTVAAQLPLTGLIPTPEIQAILPGLHTGASGFRRRELVQPPRLRLFPAARYAEGNLAVVAARNVAALALPHAQRGLRQTLF